MSRQRDLDIRKLQGDVAAAERIDRIDRCGAQVVACAVAQHVFAACGKTRRQCPLQDQSDGEQQPCDTYRLHARTLRPSQKLAARNANPTRTNAMPRTTNDHSPPKKSSSHSPPLHVQPPPPP